MSKTLQLFNRRIQSVRINVNKQTKPAITRKTHRHLSLYLLLLFSGSIVNLQAQQVKIDFSSKASIENDITKFHRYGSYIYANKVINGKMQLAYSANLKKVKFGLELVKYDEDLKVVKSLSLDNNETGLGPFSPQVHFGERFIYALYCKYTDDDKIHFYVTKVNPEDLEIIATKEVLDYNQKNQAVLSAMKTIEGTQIFFTVSEDGKNAWVIHASPKQILSCVIDGDLNVTQKAQATPINLEKLLVTGSHIGNDGHKAIVYRYDNPSEPEFYTRGLYFEPANSKGTFKTIKFPRGSAPGNLMVQRSKDGKKIYLAGEYYGDDFTFGGQGVALGEIDIMTKTTTTPKLYPYTNELKQRIFDIGYARKKKGEIVFLDYHLDYRLDEMENGTIVLSSGLKSSASTSKYDFYYHGPIIHMFIQPNGNVVTTVIPKKQLAASATGFFNYIYKDKLICIYGDHPDFLKKEITDKQIGLVRTPGAIVPVANIYTADGILTSRKILMENTKTIDGNVMIADHSLVKDNQFLMPIGKTKVNMVKYYSSVNQVCYVAISD